MSDCLPGHVAIDSNNECSSACILQLHKMDLFNKMYGCLGILMGYQKIPDEPPYYVRQCLLVLKLYFISSNV